MAQQAAIPVVAAVICNAQRQILITKRLADRHFGGLWEFPGGKIDAGESPQEALKRELAEELGIKAEVNELLMEQTFTYPEKTVHIQFFKCKLLDSPEKIRPIEVADFRWVSPPLLHHFDFPAADATFIEFLQKEIKGNGVC